MQDISECDTVILKGPVFYHTNMYVIKKREIIPLSSSFILLPPTSSLHPLCWFPSCVSTCQTPWLKLQTNLKGLEPISDTSSENAQKHFLGRPFS